ncbi:dihydrofolate reductase family protein [Oligoflexus tunisiensis]|uniref:dihydrofolate reductase family protein n=1 Tax=Oligoflexus tunisiensis TaxID=708132 RepID=UPI001C4014AB|nr:dihydrofolate reductase family protein [Oligoflexus tunisiensis]
MSITLHMVASLDGFIAKKDDDYSWMDVSWSAYDKGMEMTADILETIDCYIIGSRTYELALKLGWPYAEKRTIVATKRKLTAAGPNVEFYSGDLVDLAKSLAQKNVWLVGGPTLYREFFPLNLVDKICLTVVPILLGSGVALFDGKEQKLRLTDMSAFKNGMIDLWYEVVRNP